MRFRLLALERYGSLTDREIRFRQGARLHVVHGRNEAGKSTALAAIADLLFGFEHRTRFDFLHAAPDLRIGAEIVASGGEHLAFRRRKGRRDTLRGADETALGDDALTPFLGGVTRGVFTRAFGLSTETLREGAQDMLKADGDIGASLFAAASGLHEPSELRRHLDTEADAIFAPRAAKDRRFYQALDRFEAARKAMREDELRGADWKALNAGIAELADKLRDIDGQRSKTLAEKARLLRLKRLAPLARLFDQAVEALDDLGAVLAVPPGFAERLRRALAREVEANERRGATTHAVELLRREREALSVDDALVARAAEIAEQFAKTGQYAKAKEDLPGVDREAEGLRQDLEALARRLGLACAADIDRHLPSDADLAALRGLCKEGQALEVELAGLSASLARERQAHGALAREAVERGGTAQDPEPLRERLAAFEPGLRRLEQKADLQRAIEQEARAIAEAALRLDPSVAALDALAAVPLPAPETIARFRRDFDRLGKTLDRAREAAQAAARACLEIETALERLSAGRKLPSSEAIAAERSGRDAEWAKLRAALHGAALAPAARSSSVAGFERHLAEADRLADEALGDAKRVAEHALQQRNLGAARERQAKAQAALAEIEAQERELTGAWRAAFASSGVSPLTPAEMAPWSAAVAALLDRRTQLDERRQKLMGLEQEGQSLLPGLREMAQAIGLQAVAPAGLDEAPALIAGRLEARLRRLSDAWQAARGLAARIDASRARVEELEASLQEASNRSHQWTQRWRAGLPKLGLAPATTLAAAEAAIKAWDEVPDAMRLIAREERRIAGMRRDNLDFERRTMELMRALAPDLVEAPAQIATKALHERAAAAAQAAARRRDYDTRLSSAIETDRLADEGLAEARAALAGLAAEAGLGESGSLQAVLMRLDRHAALRAELRDRHENMLSLADGLDEESIKTELAGFDADTLEQRLSELERETERLELESKESFAEHDREVRRRAALELGAGAELAAQKRRNAEGELAAAARDWAVLKLGALLLGRAIERHREAAHNPLMARAGEVFATLTGGAFSGLGSLYDEGDLPLLVARRANGAGLRIEALSEGTRDQLYLALRLAYVESYASRLEPPPFIADDIFVTFDDERTAHGVAALAEIGANLQCILFTHHRRTAEIAAERLGDEADIIELQD
ncbi:Uncharacterized protein YhaN [Rhizobiales bacterium GAS191]|nr:Uncharacterized protein YhaN [Rhizobiales bacterium GAS191]